jgi:hypothetical protein
MLELDHVLCMANPYEDWADRLASTGWALDAGTAHSGQGTHNRRLVLRQQFLELLWVEDEEEARRNPLRLDRRADWRRTGASPFGFGLRGRIPAQLRRDYWLLEGLPMQVWVHRDNEQAPERPLVFVLDVTPRASEPLPGRGPAGRPVALMSTAGLVAVRHTGPAPARLPDFGGPPVEPSSGEHRLELVVDQGRPITITEVLAIDVRPGRVGVAHRP